MYWTLLRLPGAAGFVGSGFVARMPIAMRSIGCILMVSALTGSYTLAGAVAATLTLVQAAIAPAAGRLTDRSGQHRVIAAALPVNVLGTVALVLLAHHGAPAWTLFPAAFVVGVSSLPVGSLVRARWSHTAAGTPHLSGAYALEGVLDEFIYVVGPMLVTALAVGVNPIAGLLGALVLYVAGSAGLGLQRGTEPPVQDLDQQVRKGNIVSIGFCFLLFIYLATGVFFGAFDVALIAFAEERGSLGSAGFLLGLLAVSSTISGLAYGIIKWKVGPERRLLFSTMGLAAGTIPLAFADSILMMAVLTVVAGLAVCPILISANSLVEVLVSRGSMTEGFAWLSSSITAGMALGAAAGGWLADRDGSLATLSLAIGCACVGFVATASGVRTMKPRNPESEDELAVASAR